MAGLSSLVHKVYPSKSKEDLEAVVAFGAWMSAMSPRVLKNARPIRLQRGTLTVHAINGAWASSLQLESESLLVALKRKVPGVAVNKLFIRVGPLPNVTAPLRAEPEPEPPLPIDQLPEDLARELARVHNDDVRRAIARAAAAGMGRPARKPAPNPVSRGDNPDTRNDDDPDYDSNGQPRGRPRTFNARKRA
jgi:Dna[CI] antecedent, DciA